MEFQPTFYPKKKRTSENNLFSIIFVVIILFVAIGIFWKGYKIFTKPRVSSSENIQNIVTEKETSSISTENTSTETTLKSDGIETEANACETCQPGEQLYIVKEGDTLYAIGKQYGVEYKTIMERNGIEKAETIDIGDKIIIPAKVIESQNP